MFPYAGAAYRRVFMDLRAVVAAVPVLTDGALLLDVGGGDGTLISPLLDRQPGLRVVMLDIAPGIGTAVRADHAGRVDIRPETSLRDYLEAGGEQPSAVLLSDVFHHVDPSERADLVKDILEVFRDARPLVVVKDVEPGGVRAWAAFAADRHISRDPAQPMSRAELVALFRSVRPETRAEETNLYASDQPNYCLVLT